jgi:hypothetical protein
MDNAAWRFPEPVRGSAVPAPPFFAPRAADADLKFKDGNL